MLRHVQRKRAAARCYRIVQGVPPSRSIARGIAGPGLLAQIIVHYIDALHNRFLGALRNAQSLDLYELSRAIIQMISDPKCILEVRRHLHLDAKVMYFEHRRSMHAPGRVLQLLPT